MGAESRRNRVAKAARKGGSRPKARAMPKAKPPAPRPRPKPAKGEPVLPPRGDGRRHVLSLSFLRDGDEFMARLETDAGEITELKNRSLDQLLTLVANELEDLLE